MRDSTNRPKLRDFPFCHTKGSNDEKLYLMENHAVYDGGSYAASYSIFCTECGVELHDEYIDDLVSKWSALEREGLVERYMRNRRIMVTETGMSFDLRNVMESQK